MAKAIVSIYDSEGNVVDTLPYGTNGIVGTKGTGQGQQVHVKYDENGNKTYFAPGLQQANDPFEKAALDIDEFTEIQAPQVKIENGTVTLNAPQEVLDSPLAEQVRQELKTLRGADLNSAETKDAINALNEEIRNTVRNWTIQGTLGWTEQEFADYQRLLQAMRQPNPMSSTDLFQAKRPGADFYYDEDGRNVLQKTPQEWIDYWKENFTADQRTELFMKSQESSDPYERVMGLIMSAGGLTDKDERGYNKALYGYDFGEYLGKFWESLWGNMKLFPKGVAQQLSKSSDYDLLQWQIELHEQMGNQFNPDKAAEDLDFVKFDAETHKTITPWTESKEAFDEFLKRVQKKSWDKMNEAEKLFQLEWHAARHAIEYRDDDNELYERIKSLDNNYWNLWNSYKETEAEENQRINDSLWAQGNVQAGNILGVIGRYAWEAATLKALSGVAVNKISDSLGYYAVGKLAQAGIAPTSPVGQGVLQFIANLAGTIPEDIIQTAIDNVLTDNADQNQYLFDIGQMSTDLRNNLVIMMAFNAARAGISGIGRIKFARQMKKLASLSDELDFTEDEINKAIEKATEAAEIVQKGGRFEVADGKVYVVDADGNRSVMEGLTVEQAQMMNKAVYDAEVGKPVSNNSVSSTDLSIKDVTLSRSLAELEAEKANATARLEQLEAQKKAWVDNDYKDADGTDVRQRQQTEYSLEEIYGTSKLEQLESEIDATKRRIAETDAEIDIARGNYEEGSTKTKYEEAVEKVGKNSDNVNATTKATDGSDPLKSGDSTSTTKVDTDADSSYSTARAGADGVSTGFRSLDNAFKTKPVATPEGIRRWHPRALNNIMKEASTALFREFKTRFGDVRASDFDWVFHNISQGKSISEIIGSIDPTTNRVVNQNMIDAMKWWADHPMVRLLREKSREGLGHAGDYNKLGYLPHTNYDPSAVTFEEARAGQLWKRFTGKSMQNDAGEYVGFGGDLEGRYRTYASNMLWDMNSKEIIAAKLIEEAELDGKKLSADEALKMADEVKKLDEKVMNSKSSKSMEKGAMKDGSAGVDDFKKAAEEVEKEAPNSGAGRAVHDAYGGQYIGHNQATVSKQPSNKIKGNVALNTQGDTMRNVEINFRGRKMNMYDSGGADLVYAPQNAFELVSRVQNEGLGWKEAITEYVMEHSKRSREYAEKVADNMIAKMAKDAKGGKITKGAAIKSLSRSFKSEAWARYRRFLVLAKYDEFNAKTKSFIDDFTFRHMQLDNFVNNQGIISKLTNKLVELRYDALFYGNLKNALLQVSELNRLFTSFKYRDVGAMLHKMATDKAFRARVDMYVEAVAPKTNMVDAALYGRYGDAADAMEVTDDGVKFKKFKDGRKALDDIALAPINSAEALKNRTMVAALVAESDRLGYTGNEALMHIRQRFERVALAQNEMGRLGLASNPIARPMLFLQNFQMRELGMHYYNILDPDDLDTGGKMDTGGTSKAKLRWNAAKYIIKVLGTKLGTTLILARLGYDASQTLGLDPFGIANNYDGLSDDERTWVDDQISHGILTPFVSGGITSLFADMYFMAREAYEDAHRTTITEEARENLNKGIGGGADWSAVFNLDNLLDVGKGFVPGSTAYNRIDQMNKMMDSGWATSASGNKMYTKPDDALNTVLGYLFGRSATQNALDYRQAYGDDLGQTLSRTVGKFLADAFGGGYNELDAIDQENFSDWFDGSENDAQQFEKGRRYFAAEKKRILKTYNDALNDGFGTDDEEAEAVNDMNRQLDDLYDRLGRFVDAYEKQHGTITGKMVKQIVNLLNQEVKTSSDSPGERSAKGLDENSKALERYTQLGFPNVGTYTGPTKKYPDTEVKYQGSPQWRIKSGTKYSLREEAVAVLDAGDAVLKDLRKGYKDSINAAYDNGNYDEVKRLQKEYLAEFDNVVGPILATYGNGILSNGEVVEKLREMLSTDSGLNTDLVPRDDWSKGTNNRYISSKKNPLAGVNLKKWLKERYSSDVFQTPTIRSGTTTQDDIDNIKRLASNGETGMARALALTLKVRIDNQVRTISESDYKWLLNFLNNGGTR